MRFNCVTKGHGPCLVDSSEDGETLKVVIWWGKPTSAGQYEHSTGYIAPLTPFASVGEMSALEQATRFVIAQFEISNAKPTEKIEFTLAGDPVLWMGTLVPAA